MIFTRMMTNNPRKSSPTTLGTAICHAGMVKEEAGQPAREMAGCMSNSGYEAELYTHFVLAGDRIAYILHHNIGQVVGTHSLAC